MKNKLIINFAKNIDLIFSENDHEENGKGYYFQNFKNNKTSQLYRTQFAATNSWKTETVRWE